MATVTVSLEELLARLRAAARLAERLHRENLELFTEEARRLLSRGDVRDAAEKAWAAYKSLLGLILATRGLPLIEERIRRIWEREGAARAEKLLEWWSGTGLLVPSARQKLDAIVDLAVEATGDKEIAAKLHVAALLHVFFHHGPDIAVVSERRAAEAVQDLIDWVKKKAKQYKLLQP